MRHNLYDFWYYFRVGPLFTFLDYLGKTVVGIGILVGITFTISGLLFVFGHVSKEAFETLLGAAIAAISIGFFIRSVAVLQLPNTLPPDKRPRR